MLKMKIDQVNLNTPSGTSGKLNLDHNPCTHVIVACITTCIYYTLYNQYFATKPLLCSYSKSIYQTGSEIDWIIPYDIQNKVILPLKTTQPTRRPRKVRILYGGEGKCTSRYN